MVTPISEGQAQRIPWTLRALNFLRITDPHDNMLSLTNIAVLVSIAKIIANKNASVTELGTLVVAMLGYNAKKLINQDSPETASSLVVTPNPIISVDGGASQ